MFQISVGSIAREYCVLAFNCMLPMSDVVDSKMYQWKQAGPVCAHVRDDVGKTATTWFSAAAHARHTWRDLSTLTFSLVAIRIGTGRRHQIRTHITHLGHPSVLDAKYADSSVLEVEAEKLGQRLLMRHGMQVQAAPLQSKRFQTVYPQHIGVDAQTLNPALTEMLTGQAFPSYPSPLPQTAVPPGLTSDSSLTSDGRHEPLLLQKPRGTWSRDGPCSRAPRRKDAEGRNKDRCMVCGQFGHWSRDCPNGGKNRCLVCGQMGHRAKDCPEGGDTCLYCGRVGHLQKECPQLHPGVDAWKPVCFDFKTDGSCRFGKRCPFQHLDA